jgi:hypothetical protein
MIIKNNINIMDKKQKLLSEIESGLKEVKLMQEGKLKKKTLKEMLNFVEVLENEKIPNKTTLKAMKDAEEGKLTKAKNVKDLIEKLNK